MRKTLALLASAALMGLTLSAHADTFTYNYSNPIVGLAFNFTSTAVLTGPVNLLTSPLILNETCIVGGVTCATFGSNYNGATMQFTAQSSAAYRGVNVASWSVGTYSSGSTIYTVTLNPSVAATPEPSSLALLGTGILGVFGAARRRFLNA